MNKSEFLHGISQSSCMEYVRVSAGNKSEFLHGRNKSEFLHGISLRSCIEMNKIMLISRLAKQFVKTMLPMVLENLCKILISINRLISKTETFVLNLRQSQNLSLSVHLQGFFF